MSGSLIKIDEEIVTSAVASVTLGGADWDSSYDVYQLVINRLQVPLNDYPRLRVLVSGTADTSANYDNARKSLKADTTFSNDYATNETSAPIMLANIRRNDTDPAATGNGVYYLFNFNNASEYSFGTIEETHLQAAVGTVYGSQGGFVNTVAQSCNGVEIFLNGGNNIQSNSRFVLYGLKK